MDTLLWVVQAILAIKLVSVAVIHGLMHQKPTVQEASRRMGPSAPLLLNLAAAAAFLGALGLILPGLLGMAAWVTPFSAAILAVMLMASIAFHRRSRDDPKIFVSLVLCFMALFVTYGRAMLAL
jgi:cytochrome bd-type quinol oxidase subunit 2